MKDHDHNLKALFPAAKLENLTFNNSKCVFARTEIDLLTYRISHNLVGDQNKPCIFFDIPGDISSLVLASKFSTDIAKQIRMIYSLSGHY